MNTKLNLLLVAIGLCISTGSAQTNIIGATVTDQHVNSSLQSQWQMYQPGNTIPQSANTETKPFYNSGVAAQDKGNGHMVVNVYESSQVQPAYEFGSYIFQYVDPNTPYPNNFSILPYMESVSLITWQEFNSLGMLTNGNTHTISIPAADPDVEFSPDYETFFVSFKNSASTSLHIQKWTWDNFFQDYFFISQVTIPTLGTIGVSNIDIAMYSGEPQGVITWYDYNGADKIYACAFDQGLAISPRVEIADDGRGPDVAVCSNSELYHISYMTYNTEIKVKTGAWGDLMSVIPPTPVYTSPTDGYNAGRIASPHNQSGGLNSEDYTVVASAGNNMIRGFSYFANNGTYQDYDISTSAGTSDNRDPVVCYNSDRIKCMWTADYTSGNSSYITPFTDAITKDVLLAELDPQFYGNINGNQIFEVNNTNTLEFWNSTISIAETRNEQAPTNSDYNAFLFGSANLNGGAPASYELHNKIVYNQTASKRLAITETSEWTLINDGDNYILEGFELDQNQYELRNIHGQKILIDQLLQITNESVSIKTTDLTSGIYFLNCYSNGKTESFKLLVK